MVKITELVQDRKCWRGLTSQIEKADKVSQTKKWVAKRQFKTVSKSVNVVVISIISGTRFLLSVSRHSA